MAQPEFEPYRKLQAKTEIELRRILESTAKAIERRVAGLPVGLGGQVRAAQLRVTLAAVRKLVNTMWVGRINPLVARAIEDSLKAGDDAVEALTRVAYAGLPEAAAESLVVSLRASAESGLKSDAARRKRDLSRRVYHHRALDDGKVEQIIRQGLISGLSAKELAADVRKYVSPTAPGGASYASQRLARTEINNAFHERAIEGAKRPGVKAVKWNLSGSHKVPDLCNVYAAHGGNGEWPKDEIPDKPHPNCFCFLTYVTVPPEEFRKQLAAGDFDDEITRRTRENMTRLGQPVGQTKPKAKDVATSLTPAQFNQRVEKAASGQAALDSVPLGLERRPRPSNFTQSMVTALNRYTGRWYEPINKFLRGEKLDPQDNETRVRELIGDMDPAFDLSFTTSDSVAYRGLTDASKMFGDALDSDLTGVEWREDAYVSTTALVQRTRAFMRGGSSKMRMRILVPTGTSAIEGSPHDAEAEVLLRRGLTMRVVKDHGVNPDGVREIDVEISGGK